MKIGVKRLLDLGFVFVGLVYLIQLPTPLRVNWDAVSYLSLAASFHDGTASLLHGNKSHFPSGYPLIVAVFERLGCARSLTFVGWNLLMMSCSTAVGVRVLMDWLHLPKLLALLLALMNLLGWATMRYALIPGSEPTYIAISFLCLLCINKGERSTGDRWWMWWIAAVLLIPLAMSVRSIGVVLPPAAVWLLIVILWQRRKTRMSFGQWIAARRGMLSIASLLAVVTMAILISRLPYFHEDVARMNRRGFFAEAFFTEKQRCMEMTSLLFNIPSKNVLLEFHRAEMYFGGPCLALILLLIIRRLRSPTGIDVYLVLYTCVLLVWPYDIDVRFWLPVQLLIFGIIARELLDRIDRLPRRAKAIQACVAVWIAFFTIVGVGSFAWNTKLSYSGNQFGELWDLHSFRDTYRVAFHNGLPPDPSQIHPDLLDVLKRFGRPYADNN